MGLQIGLQIGLQNAKILGPVVFSSPNPSTSPHVQNAMDLEPVKSPELGDPVQHAKDITATNCSSPPQPQQPNTAETPQQTPQQPQQTPQPPDTSATVTPQAHWPPIRYPRELTETSLQVQDKVGCAQGNTMQGAGFAQYFPMMQKRMLW